MPPLEAFVTRDGLRLFSPPASLIGVTESFFARNPVESQVVLASLRDVSELLRLLLNGGHSAKAGYLAGALRKIGRNEQSDEIIGAMKTCRGPHANAMENDARGRGCSISQTSWTSGGQRCLSSIR